MAVPASGGAYLAKIDSPSTQSVVSLKTQSQGGTVLGNTSTNTGQITKALSLISNATDWNQGTLPRNNATGLIANTTVNSNGTFAYQAAAKYVIARHSTTLSGVSNTKLLFMGKAPSQSIAQFRQSFGAKTVTAFRYGRFSWTSTLVTGAASQSRHNWLAAGGASVSVPAALNENMWSQSGSAVADWEAGVFGLPTRAIPGELVMKVDFVTLTLSGGDFFDYAAITGM